LDAYLTAIESGQTPMADKEVLTREQEMIEAIYLGLRMTQGIDLIRFKQKFGIDFSQTFKDSVSDLAKRNYLKVDASYAALTRQGRAFLDSITSMLIVHDFSEARGKR
jgi:oxygen-independent coproporphyrinogen-3 oxidase